MKNLLWFLILPLIVFTSCSKDEEDNSTKLTVWKQDIGDKTYWFRFYKGTVFYTEAAKGDDPFNYLGEDFQYSDESNIITIYKNTSSALDKTIWLSGYISNNIMHLSGENESFELTKYYPN